MGDDQELSELVEEHRKLDEKIERVQAHPGSDDAEIAELKKLKLGLKDRIAEIQSEEKSVA